MNRIQLLTRKALCMSRLSNVYATYNSINIHTTVISRTADENQLNAKLQKITLLGVNNAQTTISFEEAQKLAKRRDMHLQRVNSLDTKSGRALYKLVTASEMLSDELGESKSLNSEKSSKRAEKSLTIGARITEHDLSSRLKNISKWLNKRHEVRILIQATAAEESNAQNIFKAIETTIKEPQIIGKIVQKRNKGGVIKFNILPLPSSPSSAPPSSEKL